jgi:hypothetical protein
VADVLEDGDFDLPALRIKVWTQGRTESARDSRSNYRRGAIPGGQYCNHYGEYFGRDFGLIAYECSGAAHRRLLVISDSFDNCLLEPLLAAHYRWSWFVDPRYYERDVGAPFCLDAAVRELQIDDVVFFGNQNWVLGMASVEWE